MAEKKSKPYTISGVSFAEGSQAVFLFNSDDQIVGVSERLSNGNVKPVEPNTTDYNQAVSSDEALRAYNVNKYKGNKSSYETAIIQAADSEISNFYTRQNKSFNNRSFISSRGVSNIAQYASASGGYGSESGTYQNFETSGTFSKLGRKDTAKIHAYPMEIDVDQDHMKITRYQYLRADINASKGVRSKKAGNEERGGVGIPIENVAGDSVKGGNPTGTIILPMPKATDVNAVAWGKSELNASGIMALGAAEKVVQGLDVVASPFVGGIIDGKNQLKEAAAREAKKAQKRGNFLSGGVGSVAQSIVTSKIAQSVSGMLGTEIDPDTYFARTGGRVLNPNAEMLFQGPAIRDFSFSFQLVARSQKEGDEIRKIIRMLKVGMAPKFNNTAFLSAPDIFTLEYKNGKGKKDVLPTVNLFNPGGLALTTMNVDYAPNGYWSAYRDSQPVVVKMDLNFTELRPIYQSDQLDTPDNSVGY